MFDHLDRQTLFNKNIEYEPLEIGIMLQAIRIEHMKPH